MTTPAAARLYAAQHEVEHQHRGIAIHNPHGKPIAELPVIYGFNNGGHDGWLQGVLIAEDGTHLGGHCCSEESYMRADLGILEGTALDKHRNFIAHYPDGYRMEFVGYDAFKTHEKLKAACALGDEKYKAEDAAKASA